MTNENKRNKLILVLDREEYIQKEKKIKEYLQENYADIEVVYTTYENKLIRRVRSWKFIGKALQHLLYWGLSYQFAGKIYKKEKIVMYYVLILLLQFFWEIRIKRKNIT